MGDCSKFVVSKVIRQINNSSRHAGHHNDLSGVNSRCKPLLVSQSLANLGTRCRCSSQGYQQTLLPFLLSVNKPSDWKHGTSEFDLRVAHVPSTIITRQLCAVPANL